LDPKIKFLSLNKILITGSSGLIGSEVVVYFCKLGWEAHGFDNNMRASFFGPNGDTRWNQQRLLSTYDNFKHHELDIRNRQGCLELIQMLKPDVIVHAAAQPSHDLAASRPFDDFDVNAVGTLNLLEAYRQVRPDGVFVHMSTNKVYGDAPNSIALRELDTRWDHADPRYENGIGAVYNIGGGRNNSCSIFEAFAMVEAITGKKQIYEYIEKNRDGDHICYISDLTKMRTELKGWDISVSLPQIMDQLVRGWHERPKK
jgi:nucleoside-diphosphate-sugar epimerase